jgi:hypothetical protein
VKAIKTNLLLPPIPAKGPDDLKLVTVYLTKHPITKESFGGIQWRIAKRFYMITPRNVTLAHIAENVSFYNESDVCFLCPDRPQCLGKSELEHENCFGRLGDVRIRHHTLDFDRFLLSSLFDESSNLKVIRNWTIHDIYERRKVIECMLKFCTHDLIPSRCDNCFLVNQCPQSFKLRALTERCFPADCNWVKDRLSNAHCVKINGSLAFEFNWASFMSWSLLTYLVYRPTWICRDKSKVYGSRLIDHSFLKKSNQVDFWATSPVQKIEQLEFHPIQSNIEMFYALRSLARQARSLCIVGTTQGGNLGPFTQGDSVSSILKEISYYWPIIHQALAQRTDVWNLSHMS